MNYYWFWTIQNNTRLTDDFILVLDGESTGLTGPVMNFGARPGKGAAFWTFSQSSDSGHDDADADADVLDKTPFHIFKECSQRFHDFFKWDSSRKGEQVFTLKFVDCKMLQNAPLKGHAFLSSDVSVRGHEGYWRSWSVPSSHQPGASGCQGPGVWRYTQLLSCINSHKLMYKITKQNNTEKSFLGNYLKKRESFSS